MSKSKKHTDVQDLRNSLNRLGILFEALEAFADSLSDALPDTSDADKCMFAALLAEKGDSVLAKAHTLLTAIEERSAKGAA